MLAVSPLETVELVVWAIGIAVAVRLFRSPSVDRGASVVLLVLALAVPVLGAIGVLGYAARMRARRRRSSQVETDVSRG